MSHHEANPSAFTPGPWDYSFVQWPKGEPLGFAVRPASEPARTEKRGVSIASVNCAEPNITATAVYTTEELQANARLIAAAPRLYAACKAGIDALVRLHSIDHDYLLDCDCKDGVAFREINAALNLAEGVER